MKNAVLLFGLLAFSYNTQAQDALKEKKTPSNKNEINAGYGYVTREQLLNDLIRVQRVYIVNDSNYYDLSKVITYKVFGNYQNVDFGNRRRSGAFMLTYRRTLLPWLTVGVTAGYERDKQDLNTSGKTIGTYKRSAFTLAPECQVIYKHKGIVTYYGFLGVGNAFIRGKYTSNTSSAEETYSANMINPQITPFGIKVGKRLSGYGEVGFGYKGIVHLGAAYAF